MMVALLEGKTSIQRQEEELVGHLRPVNKHCLYSKTQNHSPPSNRTTLFENYLSKSQIAALGDIFFYFSSKWCLF